MEEWIPIVLALVGAAGGAGLAEAALKATVGRIRSTSNGDADRVKQAELEEILRQATKVRTNEGPPAEPSTPAKEEAIVILRAYSRDLLAEAGRIAKRAGADRASKTHVREAASRIGILRSRAGVVSDIVVVVGGLLLGGAVSYQVNLWTGGKPAEGAGVFAALAFGLGFGLMVGGTAAKWYKR